MTTSPSPSVASPPSGPESDYPTASDRSRRRARRRGLIIGGGVVLVALVVFVLTVFQPQKLFIDDVVDEALPGLVVAGQAPPSTTAPTAAPAPEAVAPTPAPEPAAPAVEASPGPVASPVPVAPAPPPAPADPLSAALAEAQRTGSPVAVTTGSFVSLDHPTAGQAYLVVQPDGSRILRIEDLNTDNGPDVRVVLSTAEVGTGDYGGLFELGRLKGNIGSQNYDIPADLDLTTIRSVVIWCERFSAPFGEAPAVIG